MSTDPGLDLDAGYRLNPRVALRPEPFGAMAYHFGNRKLSFLKTPEMVTLVRSLESHSCVRTALRECGIPEGSHSRYAVALASLAATDMIVPSPPEEPSP